MLDATKEKPKCPDILRWQPSTWDGFLGNYRVKKHFRQLAQQLRVATQEGKSIDSARLSMLLYGPSRSGKTALVKFLVRCITCQEFDQTTLNPCRKTCAACKQRQETYGLEGLFSELLVQGRSVPVHYLPIDCTKIYTPSNLEEKLKGHIEYSGLIIYYLDEVHRLVNRHMDEILLKYSEESNNLMIFSTAKPKNLEDMFLNRLIKFKTQLPEKVDLEDWLIARCNEWGIKWEPEAIVRVVDKSNLVVGTALHALAFASINPAVGLTLDLVENDWLVKLDE